MENEQYTLLPARFYTRVREDRPGMPGSTPTKLEFSASLLLDGKLPQLNPFSDIPYSSSFEFCKKFKGKCVLLEHYPHLGTHGFVHNSYVTEDPEHIRFLSFDNNCVYNETPLRFCTILGWIAALKSSIPQIKNIFKVLKFQECDLSMGYTVDTELAGDIVTTTDKVTGEMDVDWEKTKLYYTNFEPIEISIIRRGGGACMGANFLSSSGNETMTLQRQRNSNTPTESTGMGPRLKQAIATLKRHPKCGQRMKMELMRVTQGKLSKKLIKRCSVPFISPDKIKDHDLIKKKWLTQLLRKFHQTQWTLKRKKNPW